MGLHDSVFDILVEKGPILPSEIVSEVNKRTSKQTDMFFIGAILSELMTEKNIKMSHAKVGGSRLYYCQGQEPRLVKLYDHLHEKEKRAYDLLKEKKVIRDSELEPVIRVAMQNLKDFAKPVEVRLTNKEVFWKWFLLPMSETENMIKEILKPEIENIKSQKKHENAKTKPEVELEKKDTEQKQEFSGKEDKSTGSSFILNSFNTSKNQQKNLDKNKDAINKFAQKETVLTNKSQHSDSAERQSTLSSETNSQDLDDEFVNKILNYFNKKDIELVDFNLIKKNSEAEFEVKISSQIGRLTYYVYAKSKKRISDTDLGFAYVKAQNKNLPLCFVSFGDLTKKGEELLKTDLKAASFLKINQ